MKEIIKYHAILVDSSEGEISKFDRIAQEEEVLVRFAVRCWCYPIVQFDLSKVRDVPERSSLRIRCCRCRIITERDDVSSLYCVEYDRYCCVDFQQWYIRGDSID